MAVFEVGGRTLVMAARRRAPGLGARLSVAGAPCDPTRSRTFTYVLLSRLDPRFATAVRLAGLLAIGWTVFTSQHARQVADADWRWRCCRVGARRPGSCGRALGREHGLTPELYVLAPAGGLLCGACPDSAASAFVFVAVVTAGVRAELKQAAPVVAVGTIAVAIAFVVYGGSALGALAYGLGFTLALLAAATRRQSALRAEQAELLLAQTQRSHEEQLRARAWRRPRGSRASSTTCWHTRWPASRFSSRRPARCSRRAPTARSWPACDGSRARARGHARHAPRGRRPARRRGCRRRPIEALSTLPRKRRARHGDDRRSPGRLDGATGQELFRVTQEALTNVRKHAPGAPVAVTLHAGEQAGQELVLTIDNQPGNGRPAGAARRARREWRGLRRARHARRRDAPRRNVAGRRERRRLAGAAAPAARGLVVSAPVRVLVVDDQALVREGLMTLLESAAGIEPVGAAGDGEEAIALTRRHRPDVVLMDLRMPKLDGVEATRRIRAELPTTEVVVLTTHADETSILDALQAGARGYLTKDAGIAEISRAVQAAADHQSLLDPAVHANCSRLRAATARPPRPRCCPTTSPRARPRC